MVTSTWVYTPKPGTINKQIELAEKFTEIWKKYGAKEVNLYTLSGAQMGNLALLRGLKMLQHGVLLGMK